MAGCLLLSFATMSTSTLVSWKTTASYSSFDKVSQFTAKEYIHISASRSSDLDQILINILLECLDFILPSLRDLINSSLAFEFFHNASNQLLSHKHSKREKITMF